MQSCCSAVWAKRSVASSSVFSRSNSVGRVTYCNPTGEDMLGDGIDIVDEHLQIGSAGERESIAAIIHRIVQGTPSEADHKPIIVSRAALKHALVVYVLPIPVSTHPAIHFLTHARAIVLAIDSRPDEPADPTIVRDVLGLTLGEARIAALIGFGLPPREAAQRLGITEKSTRTALKRVFAKVGVSRQSELAALLTRLVLR